MRLSGVLTVPTVPMEITSQTRAKNSFRDSIENKNGSKRDFPTALTQNYWSARQRQTSLNRHSKSSCLH